MIKNAAAVLLLLFGVNIASANFLISNTFTEQMGRCEISFYDETLLADILISGIASYIDADEIEAKQFINSRLDELTQLYGFTSFGLEIDNFQSYTEGADKFVSELNTLIPEFEQELAKLSPSNYRGLFGYGDSSISAAPSVRSRRPRRVCPRRCGNRTSPFPATRDPPARTRRPA